MIYIVYIVKTVYHNHIAAFGRYKYYMLENGLSCIEGAVIPS